MSDRHALAALFQELTVLLELGGENPFKIRAIAGAVRILESETRSLRDIAADPPKGFGKGLVEKVEEFLNTGALRDLETWRQKIPAGMLDLLDVQGLGPQKVRQLFHEAGITDLEALRCACEAGKIRDIKGFGLKTEQNILAGIKFLQKSAGAFLLIDGVIAADILREHLARLFPELVFHVAGSVRRHKEVVHDIDVLTAAADAGPVMAAFAAAPGVERVLAAGETKSSVLLKIGMQVDLRVVPPGSLGTALLHFTGSKDHNTLLRAHAQSLGLKLNEYGLFRGDESSAFATEEAVYEALGLPVIPPELREGLDEIELAKAGHLPALVTWSDLRGIAHMHTSWSDGDDTTAAMVAGARDLGFAWVGISDHSRSAHYAGGLAEDRLFRQWREIDEINRSQAGPRVLKGIESDILRDGSLDYELTELRLFDFVIASIHSRLGMSGEEMTERMIKAIRNPFISVLGHMSGRLLLSREPYDADFDRILQACLDEGVAVEINGSAQRLDLDWRYVRAWRLRGLKFLLTPDAHRVEDLADIRQALGIARKGGLTAGDVLNCLSADEFCCYAQRRRPR